MEFFFKAFMVLNISLSEISTAKVVDLTTPIATEASVRLSNKSGAPLVLHENTLLESTVTYRPEDVMDKKGATPFIHSFVVAFPNLKSRLLTLLDSPSNKIVNSIRFNLVMVIEDVEVRLERRGSDTPSLYLPSAADVITAFNSLTPAQRTPATTGQVVPVFSTTGTPAITYSTTANDFTLSDGSSTRTAVNGSFTSVTFTANLLGNIIFFDIFDPTSFRLTPSLALIDTFFSDLIGEMTSMQSGDVYYKRLKVLTKTIGPVQNNSYLLNGQTVLSESSYNFNSNVSGAINDKNTNILKVLGFSLEFANTNLVSRRQVAYTCFDTSKEARSSAVAKSLATTLVAEKSLTRDLTYSLTPVYKRDERYHIPITCVIEGLRDTAAKKRRFIKTVIQTV